MNILVENMCVVHNNYLVHRYCQTPDEFCDIADALGIGVCWGFGHANMRGIFAKHVTSAADMLMSYIDQ